MYTCAIKKNSVKAMGSATSLSQKSSQEATQRTKILNYGVRFGYMTYLIWGYHFKFLSLGFFIYKISETQV